MLTDGGVGLFIRGEAVRSNRSPDKVAKELTKNRDALRSVQQSIIFDKSVDFLVSKASLSPAQS